jgi:hypothetical protein
MAPILLDRSIPGDRLYPHDSRKSLKDNPLI